MTCNICGWYGAAFGGVEHSESAICPCCNSITRDRFIYHCWVARTRYDKTARVLETSPRLGQPYRARMARRVDYLCSDWAGESHKGNLRIDLQKIELPDASLDTILTSGVMEHVPETGPSLAEMYRVLKPGGRVYLLIPVPVGRTRVPPEPEYHEDHTLVYWHFGWDLTDQVRAAGFHTSILVTDDLIRRVDQRDPWDYDRADVDVDSLLAGAPAYRQHLVSVADDRTTARLSLRPTCFPILWECRKPH